MRKKALVLAALAGTLFYQARAGRPEARTDPLDGLAAHQREYCEHPSRRRVVTGGRRSGKTEAVSADLVATAMRGGQCVYISLTAKLARKTVWNRLKKRLRRLHVAFKPNETTLALTLDGGGLIELGGCDDKEAIERYRGPFYDLVIVDECGAQNPEVLKALVSDVLRPALMDHGGRLTLAGTPGPTLGGYWCLQGGPDHLRSSSHPIWRWTIDTNPLFAGRVDAELAAVLEEEEWAPEGQGLEVLQSLRETLARGEKPPEHLATFCREYLGLWVQDDGVLVYPYRLDRNGLDRLPTRTERGHALRPDDWRRVIAVDVGTSEKAMAIVVWASHPGLPDDYLVHAEAHTGMLVGSLAERLRLLKELYPGAPIVLDSGGMGKAHALELQGRFSLAIEPAEKSEKVSAIRIMRDRVLAGRVKVLNLPTLDGVRAEWSVLGWDDKHEQHHPSQADHYSDAALYGLRRLRNWRHDGEHGKPKPRHDSPEALREAMEQEAEPPSKKGGRLVQWTHRLRLGAEVLWRARERKLLQRHRLVGRGLVDLHAPGLDELAFHCGLGVLPPHRPLALAA